MKKMTQVYISNISEDVWSFISELEKKKRKAEIAENAFLADRDLLTVSNHSNNVIILPQKVDPAFLKYYLQLFNKDEMTILVPSKHTGQICKDILQDPKIFKKLLTLATNGGIELTSYSSSYQLLDLIHELEKNGGKVSTPESPLRQDYWTTNFFGSKSGFRQLVWQNTKNLELLRMPEAFITYGIKDTAKIATDMYLQNGVVIKTTKGHAGMGVMIIKPGSLSTDPEKCEKQILKKLKEDSYWDKFPTVIENFIEIDKRVGGGNPNVEFRVNSDGKVKYLFYCGMRVTPEGMFKGVEIYNDINNPLLMEEMQKIGHFLGTKYSEQGYRGYFDVDCIASTNGELFIAESNVRKTGGTHMYVAVKTLLGDQFMNKFFSVSNNLYALPGTKKLTFSQLLKKLSPVLFDKQKKEGVILAAANLLQQHKIAYIVVGKKKDRTLAIEKEMEEILASSLLGQ